MRKERKGEEERTSCQEGEEDEVEEEENKMEDEETNSGWGGSEVGRKGGRIKGD